MTFTSGFMHFAIDGNDGYFNSNLFKVNFWLFLIHFIYLSSLWLKNSVQKLIHNNENILGLLFN